MTTEPNPLNTEGIEQTPLHAFTEKAYLDYSMYVILDRALPSLSDGLKPVQRRIVYAMSELGLKATAKYKKSARTIGDVLGKYHPHGDGACYEAMVLMAQAFSYRYPLVDGQGNWGSTDDPKSFAAMRYTEAKLNRYTETLLSELGQGTVEWQANFDGTLEEPVNLPARLPNALLNGATGIAVGMATDIPPHNLREIVSACIHLLDSPKASLESIVEHIQGPDFPTNAEIITPKADLLNLYRTGSGSIRARAVYIRENDDIIITALPYQVSGAKVLEQIAEQMRAKKLPMVVDLRDESDHENPTRLVISLKSNRVDPTHLMDHLFATTDLEKSYRANFNMIGLNGRPKVFSLIEFLKDWLKFRLQTVTKRLEFRLDKVNKRLHILDGLLLAFLNIDEVIHIIRENDKPKPVLISRFNLSEEQADAILDLKLRHLARLEEMTIKSEQADLSQEREALEKTLSSERRLKSLVKKELECDAKDFGDDRKSPLIERTEAKAMSDEERLPSEAVTIILSEKGWIRAGKGHELDPSTLSYKAGDQLLQSIKSRSHLPTLMLDSSGRTYSIATHTLPSARSQGEPLTGRLNPPADAHFVGLACAEPDTSILLSSSAGYGFLVKLNELHTKNKRGKASLKLPKNTNALAPVIVPDCNDPLIAALSTEGRLLVFSLSELPELSRGKGNKMINIPTAKSADGSELMLTPLILSRDDSLVIQSGKRRLVLKPGDLQHYHGERARRGNKLPRGFQRIDSVSVLTK